jgi:nucleoside 2-deoxyribosyltransferase
MSPQELLPRPAVQAQNILRWIGEQTLEVGEHPQEFPKGISAIVGAPNDDAAKRLASELVSQGLIEGREVASVDDPFGLIDLRLTLAGWEAFEKERTGKFAGRYGFLALAFGNPVVVHLKEQAMRPALQGIGYDLVDMRDVQEAGIIDNLMRQRIRDSAFVLVDLSDDNRGAYWEAGFAEGLGKPVIYICRHGLDPAQHLHFDVNHATTLFWKEAEPQPFCEQLVATVRRSLGLF